MYVESWLKATPHVCEGGRVAGLGSLVKVSPLLLYMMT